MAGMSLEIADMCYERHKDSGYLAPCTGCPLEGRVEKDYCYEDAMELHDAFHKFREEHKI